jgi:hypothetical protein
MDLVSIVLMEMVSVVIPAFEKEMLVVSHRKEEKVCTEKTLTVGRKVVQLIG